MSASGGPKKRPGEGIRKYGSRVRLGCGKCKARRIKCDKEKPVCSNCQKHSHTCAYGTAPPLPNQRRGQTQLPLPSDIGTIWTSLGGRRSSNTSLLALDPAKLPTHYPSHSHPLIPQSSIFPVTMSTVDVQQYDSQFDAIIYQTYTWPAFNMNNQFFLQQTCQPMATATLGEGPKFMRMYPRSGSLSPPRRSLTPEQRELKRQLDHARRDTKGRLRRELSTSNPSTISPRGSPEITSKTYTGALVLSPLLPQGSQASPNLSNINISNISSPAYLAPYAHELDDGDMYGGVFPMVANDFTGLPATTMPMACATLCRDHSMQYTPPQSLSTSSIEQPNAQGQTSNKSKDPDSGDNVRKPQCWEHGFNGRQFSTFGNLLRHQREKSGAASKSTCPNCGAEFTRTTARNAHIAHEKCKQRQAT